MVAFAVSVPFDALAQPLARGFYATRNTLWPVLASVISLGVIVVSTNLLVPAIGMVAIPAGFALGSASKVAVMALALPRRVAGLKAPSEGAD